ncbi:MAG: DUF882 domain-containing protein [Sulfurihydrogenibium sp.]|jgi:uncharacterized protein YcbK (DUF882 family)|nr:DUF882 domain-containing protein [Sulfurihydrogenibium sp.]
MLEFLTPRCKINIYILTKTLEVNNRPINIISGYRSPKTNNLLREISSEVAKIACTCKEKQLI